MAVFRLFGRRARRLSTVAAILALMGIGGMCISAHADSSAPSSRPVTPPSASDGADAASGMRAPGGSDLSGPLGASESAASPASPALTARPRFMVGIPVNVPPLAFLNEQGTAPRGLMVDLAIMLAARQKQDIRFIQDTPQELQRKLLNGTIDFIAGLPQPKIAPDGTKVLSTPFALNRRILVAAPETHVTCEQDFGGRRILVLTNDPYADVVRKAGGTVLVSPTYQDALSRLSRGEADAFAAQSGEVASYVAQRLGMQNVRFMGLPLERIPIVMEVSESSDDLLSALTNALIQLENGGQLDLLRDKWLGRSLTRQDFWETYRHPILTGLSSGLLIMLAVIVWIITLRRQVRLTTQSLQSSERRYRELIEASPDMTLLLGQDGGIRMANRIARETLDITPETEPGSFALWDALCDESQSCLQLLLEDATPEHRIREEIILHPDRPDRRIMEFIAFPTTAGEKGDSLICCIGRDMTERRRLEQELVEVERLAILGKTAASVAHEINNPLGIIMANTDVALEETQDPALRSRLEAIQRNVERAAATTRRLLNIAMPQSINQEPQNLADILRESIAFLRPRMKNVTLDTDGLADELPLRGDRILLEQLFINLLLNALESMDNKGKLVIVGERRERDGKPVLHIEVQDSGHGIAPENLNRIFDPFFTTRGSGGFGLGLFISRRIVEAHKGTLRAESEAGRGASMITEFPLEA